MPDHAVSHATFTLERDYDAPPSRVFAAWSDPEIKRRWFAANAVEYSLDFRPGGVEHDVGLHEGKRMVWESLYREIVPEARIVYTSTLGEDDAVMSVSLTTVELVPDGDGTHLVLVEAGAYLDGWEKPEWREQGTGDWLDALGRDLHAAAPS